MCHAETYSIYYILSWTSSSSLLDVMPFLKRATEHSVRFFSCTFLLHLSYYMWINWINYFNLNICMSLLLLERVNPPSRYISCGRTESCLGITAHINVAWFRLPINPFPFNWYFARYVCMLFGYECFHRSICE